MDRPLPAASVVGVSADLTTVPTTSTTLALKEWGAAVHGLLAGRQHILLRKGGIHEKAFVPPAGAGSAVPLVLQPTVAHTHAERTRPEHHDLLAAGDADVAEDAFTIRAGVRITDIVEVVRPERLAEIADLHIWTEESIQEDRVRFRPTQALQVLVVQAVPVGPVRLPRLEAYGGCRSWIDLEWAWDGAGEPVVDAPTTEAIARRVRDSVG